MGFPASKPWKEVTEFKTSDLHKKIGQIVVIEPTDSDLQETGESIRQVWFRTEDQVLWLLWEEDA